MAGIRKIIGLFMLVITISGLALGGIQISRSITEISNCAESCFDIEHAILGFEVKDHIIPQKITIVVTFLFRNPSSLSAYVVDLPFRVEVAGVDVGEGSLCCLPLLIPGNSKTEATGIIQLPFTQVPSLALDAIREYEKQGFLRYAVRGSVTLRAAILGVVVPFIPSITSEFQKEGNYTVLSFPSL